MIERIEQAISDGWDEQLATLQQLIQTPSITGTEGAVQALVAETMAILGLETDVWTPTKADVADHPAFSDDGLALGDRPVVVGIWRGTGGGKSLILNGHTDVVPVGDESLWPYPPWSGTIADGKVYGRGSCDMKAGLAAAIYAVAALKRAGWNPRGDVFIQSVIGEETGGVGTLATLTRGYRADAAIVLEPTALAIAPVGSGALSFRLTVKGRAAHGGLRQQGISAIDCFLPVYEALQRLETDRHQRLGHPLFPKGQLAAPLSVGIVTAGDWVSTVPENLLAMGRYGVFPGESLASARSEFERTILVTASEHAWLKTSPPTVEWIEGQFESAQTSVDADLVRVLGTAHRKVTGSEPELTGVPWGSDMRFFTNHAAMPAVLYGAGDVQLAHTVKEYVPLHEMLSLTRVLALTMYSWCD